MGLTYIVSNRLPVTVVRQRGGGLRLARSAGGLVAALEDVRRRLEAPWVGYSGLPSDDPMTAEGDRRLEASGYVPVHLTADQYASYYSGLANGTLWPVFHYMLGEAHFDAKEWQAYVEVNRRFADRILELIRPGDRVWIHDYQLMLLPAMLRETHSNGSIAYFHHIPFPAYDMFQVLPWRRALLRGLLGADLIGMHTLDYVLHFKDCVARLLGCATGEVRAFPLGVDAESLRAATTVQAPTERIAALAPAIAGKTVFLGVDRLDYTKGLIERLRAFQLFLATYPEAVGQVVYLQVCVPSRQDVPRYAALRAEVERLVGQINGEYGKPGYVPLQYLFQSFTPEEVRELYRLSDIAVVTPLRDGLNLVCKEFVAAKADGSGTLILSEFAGAAAEMGEALLVNPYDVAAVAQAMRAAMTMPEDERRQRMQRLRGRISLCDNLQWARQVMGVWNHLGNADRQSRPLVGEIETEVLERLAGARRLRLFLDYDGTLVPIARRPELARPTLRVLTLLDDLAACKGVEVGLVTGRPREFCDEFFAGRGFSMAAEHGACYRSKDAADWIETVPPAELERIRPLVLPHLEAYLTRVPGSRIEMKRTALVLHYREAETAFAHAQAYDLRESLSRILTDTPYSVFQGKRAIEIKPIAANKGAAIERLLGDAADLLLLTAADDVADASMYLVRPEHNVSIHVGQPSVKSRFFVDSPDAFLGFLRRLLIELNAGGSLAGKDSIEASRTRSKDSSEL